ncbi:MAG: glycosyltransferase [Thermomonas sp.]
MGVAGLGRDGLLLPRVRQEIREVIGGAIRRRRLLVLASTYPRWAGDPEPGFVHELARRLSDHFEVLALVPHAPGALVRERLDGVEIIRYRYAPERFERLVNDGGIVANLKRSPWKYLLLPGFALAQLWMAWRLARARGIDVVHAHWLLPQGLIAILLQWLPGPRVPCLITSHGADLYALKGRPMDVLKRFVARRASALTVVSGAMREELSRIGVDRETVRVQSMGVDLRARFTPDPAVSRSGDELLFVGRLVEKKGLRYLIDSLPSVLDARPTAFLTVAGFGPEETELRKRVEALGLGDKVHFVGAVQQSALPDMYRRAALFIAPFVRASSGDQEGLGLVLVEAAGCGCPILAGDVPALDEVLGNAFGDMVVDPRDVGILARRIVSALGDPGAIRQRADQLRQSLRDRFDWESVRDAYVSLLEAADGDARR